jgi:HAD superfamily hydrolase (TIGR01459 family)
VLLSNAPMPSASVARVLGEKGVRRDSWDAIVTSGDVTIGHVRGLGIESVHHIGPARDDALFADMPAKRVALDSADAIVCTGLVEDRRETAADYRAILEAARARSLPLICANPDLIVDVGGVMLPCAGVLGEAYEAIGGEVYWAGKPHAPAYELSMAAIGRVRGSRVERSAILAIGDAVRTDLAGASAFGLDSLFIAQGIHRDAVFRDGRIDPTCLRELLAGQSARPLAAMVGVAW